MTMLSMIRRNCFGFSRILTAADSSLHSQLLVLQKSIKCKCREGLPGMGDPWQIQKCWMASPKPQKRFKVRELDLVMETVKGVRKASKLKELLMLQEGRIMGIDDLGRRRKKLEINKRRKFSAYVKLFPALFRITTDKDHMHWMEFTEEADDLIDEEEIFRIHYYAPVLVKTLKKLLMMSTHRRIRLDKLMQARNDFGFPLKLREFLQHYPDSFRITGKTNYEYVELLEWDDSLAITAREQRILDEALELDELMGHSYPNAFKIFLPRGLVLRLKGKEHLDRFQSQSFPSPYEGVSGLMPGTLEAEKRTVALIHEYLSLTLEKRCLVFSLTHFREEFKLPNKFREMLERFQGIFYVSYKGDKYTLFLKEGYKGLELVERSPLVDFRDRFVEICYRHSPRKKGRPAWVPYPEMPGSPTVSLEPHSPEDAHELISGSESDSEDTDSEYDELPELESGDEQNEERNEEDGNSSEEDKDSDLLEEKSLGRDKNSSQRIRTRRQNKIQTG